MSDSDFQCRVCDSSVASETLSTQEMMFGTREPFEYTRCGSCQTLQINRIPDDPGSYYPKNYYSFGGKPLTTKDRLKNRIGAALFLGKPDRERWTPEATRFRDRLPAWSRVLPNLSPGWSVLDVGCGAGVLLHTMASWGFRRLHGADPFVAADIVNGPIYIRKVELGGVTDSYDLVMMHHALEHVVDPGTTLAQLKAVTKPAGYIVIRIPVSQGKPFRDFGANWIHLDPPRHFHLFTVDGFTALAERNGLRVERVGFDSTFLAIAGSQLYAEGLPLTNDDGSSNLTRYTPADRAALEREMRVLNRDRDSDTAYFLLRHA